MILALENLRLYRPGWQRETDCQPITYQFKAGTITGLIGLNGSGKSTLLKTMGGILAIDPLQAQSIRLDGQSISDYSPYERARLIGYLAQGGKIEWPLGVKDVVELGRMAWPIPKRNAKIEARQAHEAALQEAIELCEIEGLLARRADELSGGEMARVLLARLVAGKSRLWLLDEPTAELDPAQQIKIMANLQSLAKRDGIAMVMALHDLALARRYCDAIMVMHQGSVRLSGRPDDVFQHADWERIFGMTLKLGHGPNIGDDWVSVLPSNL